jgi:hypothetical protein
LTVLKRIHRSNGFETEPKRKRTGREETERNDEENGTTPEQRTNGADQSLGQSTTAERKVGD